MGSVSISTALSDRSSVVGGLIASNTYHVAVTVIYIGFAMLVVPRLLKRIWRFDDSAVSQHSLVAYAIALLCFFVGVAAGLGVSTVFAAFLAGYALINGVRDRENLNRTPPCKPLSQLLLVCLSRSILQSWVID